MKNQEISRFYRRQLALFSFLPSVILIFLIAVVIIYLERSAKEQFLQNEFEKNRAVAIQIFTNFDHSTAIISRSALSIVALKFGDFNGYRSVILPWIKDDRMIKGIILYDATGKNVMSWFSSHSEKYMMQTLENETLEIMNPIVITHKIVDDNEILGSIAFYTDLESLGLHNLNATVSKESSCEIIISSQPIKICRGILVTDLFDSLVAIVLTAFGLVIIFLFVTERLSSMLSKPLNTLHQGLDQIKVGNPVNWNGQFATESESIFRPIGTHLSEAVEKHTQLAAEVEVGKKLTQLASQVAHDIRSPLTALNVAISTLDKLPEDKRVLIRNAIQRINDIANDLLTKGRSSQKLNGSFTSEVMETNENSQTVMLSSLVDILVSEKRTQYRNKIGVEIVCDLSNSYGLFSKFPANEFNRVLSNLINNAVEAFEHERGTVVISMKKAAKSIQIEIVDNGKGIPNHILNGLGRKGLSFGKSKTASGSGLGVYHAKKFIESIGGSISFESTVDRQTISKRGTKVIIIIPESSPLPWFVPKIEIPNDGHVIALDDDQSIHSIWLERLTSIGAKYSSITLETFTSVDVFRKWIQDQKQISPKFIFLVDFEFLGQEVVGLDLIEELELEKFSILVSSRYDEEYVYNRCKQLGLRIIPKAMAGLVPMEIVSQNNKFDAVLIDDDPLVHMTWNISAKEHRKRIASYRTPDDFLLNQSLIEKHTPIVVDIHLGTGTPGNIVAQNIFELGFKNVFLGSGSDLSHLENLPWIKGTLGKAPDWNLLKA